MERNIKRRKEEQACVSGRRLHLTPLLTFHRFFILFCWIARWSLCSFPLPHERPWYMKVKGGEKIFLSAEMFWGKTRGERKCEWNSEDEEEEKRIRCSEKNKKKKKQVEADGCSRSFWLSTSVKHRHGFEMILFFPSQSMGAWPLMRLNWITSRTGSAGLNC